MADFLVKGPLATTVVGTDGEDRLTYKLLSGTGGVILDPPTVNDGGGYDGLFQTAEGLDTDFFGIEHLTFIDKVGGDDTLTATGGSDVLMGRGGNDILSGHGGSDELYGGNHRDRLYGGDDGDSLYGGNGIDRMFGESGHDSLYGGDGNDRMYGGGDNDFLDGGAGDDRMFGGGGDDFIIADQGADTVDSGLGNDQVEIAFDTAKTVDGSFGKDMLMAFFDGPAPDGVALAFNLSTGVFRSADTAIAGTTAVGFENFAFQGALDIRVTGTDGGNELIGDTGNDRLFGKGGRDTLFGNDGDDILEGNRKADTLDGGLGDDVLTGGGGADLFDFSAGADRITDFSNNTDTVRISSSLVAEGTTVADLIDSATVTGGNTVFDFGGGDMLTIEGLTDATLLSDDLIIV